ncbi:DNA-binding protein HU-beta [Bacilli bacterium PM5-3]|nr:DNA-binding protein HU-beta [Bacilli bacterium PM5-3]MDH6603653.1 DNA-binding protein HU-beta [Bacilli bacterium PM5-9]
MNKTELIAFVAEQTGLSKKDAQGAVDAVVDGISASLKKGDKVSLPGFGSFDVRERAARKGVNPATGQPMDIAASKSVGFKVGKQLKDSLK